MANKIRPSKHGKLRTFQRAGVQKGLVDVTVRNAFEKGITHSELEEGTPLKKWVASIVRAKPATVRLFGEHMYLFSRKRTLITVLNIPDDLIEDFSILWREHKSKFKKKKKRNRFITFKQRSK